MNGKSPPCDSYGDVDGDGLVTSADVQLVLQHIAGAITLEPWQQERADVNGDGVIDSADVQLLQQYIVGTTDTFPVCQLPDDPPDDPTEGLINRLIAWIKANPIPAAAIGIGVYLVVRRK